MAQFLTRNAKENLLNRYEDLKFIDDVTELLCKKCNRVPIDHYIANCGHLFCSDCQRILAVGKGWKCPECKADITDITRQDAEVERRVSELKVHCPNGKYGCKVDGSLQHISDHLGLCMEPRVANVTRLNTGSQTMETMMEKLSELSQRVQQLAKANEDRQQKWQIQLDSQEKTMTWIIAENAKMRQTIAEYRLQDRDEFSSRLQKQVDRLDSKLTTADNEKTTVSNHLDKRISVADNRVATIDKNLSNINMKMAMIILFLIAATAIATAILLAFNNEMQRMNENINNKVASYDNKVATFDNRMTAIGMTVTTIDNQQAAINAKLADIDDRLTANENDVTTINDTLTTIEDKVTLNEMLLDPVDILQTIVKIKTTLNALTKYAQMESDLLLDAKRTLNTKTTSIDNRLLAIESVNSSSERKNDVKNNTEMMQTRERLWEAGELCTLKQKDGSTVSVCTWVVENIEVDMVNALTVHEIMSKPFYTDVPGYRLQFGLYPNTLLSDYIGLQMYVVQGEFDNNMSWPFSLKCEMAIVDRDGHEFQHRTINPTTETTCNRDTFARQPLFSLHGCGYSRYIKSQKLLDNKDQYLIDGNLKIKFLYYLDG